MSAAKRIDPKDPHKLLYLDVHDHRRRLPKAVLAGSSLITIYLRRELKAAGQPEGDFGAQLKLCVRRWRFIDRIRREAKQ